MDDTLEQGAEGMRKRVNNAMQRIYSQDTYGLTLDIGAVNVEVPPQQSKFTTQRVDGRKNDVYSINGNTTPHLE